MRFDVYADLDHLYMLNFSVDAGRLAKLVPPPLRVLQKRGRGFPSIVLPSIKRLRPVLTRFPAVDYELCGLRILVEYDAADGRTTKGIYFARLIMDPDWARRVANLVTPFVFEAGRIVKRSLGADRTPAAVEASRFNPQQRCAISVQRGKSEFLRAGVRVEANFPERLTPGSAFADSEEALETYNDISYGFIPSADGREVKILQIADPHPNYVAWPLVALTVDDVWVQPLHEDPPFAGAQVTREPSYFVGRLPRYWRWLQTEQVAQHASIPAPVTGDEPAQ